MDEPNIIWEQHYISLWSDGEIGVSDGVGYVGTIGAEETRELYEVLRKHYGDDKSLVAKCEELTRERDEARRMYLASTFSEDEIIPEMKRKGWDCFKENA